MTDAQRRALWVCFADQFLDTEKRQELPAAALKAVTAGCSVREGRDVWRYEVTPAVWPNLWSVAGEWAMWDEAWLAARIEKLRVRRVNRPGPLGAALYWARAAHLNRCWVALAGCMGALQAASAAGRAALASDLTALARVYFDVGIGELPRAALLATYEQCFLPIFRPLVARDAVSKESAAVCDARVRQALAKVQRPG